jgi:hypothetical protein
MELVCEYDEDSDINMVIKNNGKYLMRIIMFNEYIRDYRTTSEDIKQFKKNMKLGKKDYLEFTCETYDGFSFVISKDGTFQIGQYSMCVKIDIEFNIAENIDEINKVLDMLIEKRKLSENNMDNV